MIYNGNDYLQSSVQFQPDLGIFSPRFSGQFGLPTNCGARIRTKFILSRFVETQDQDVFWNLWHYFWWRHEVRYDGW